MLRMIKRLIFTIRVTAKFYWVANREAFKATLQATQEGRPKEQARLYGLRASRRALEKAAKEEKARWAEEQDNLPSFAPETRLRIAP